MVRRSILMMPANVERFLEKAHTYGADAIMLDLEDAVALDQKEEARKTVKAAVNKVARNVRQILVRVNNDPALIEEDIRESVCPALYEIVLPKSESADNIKYVSMLLDKYEAENRIQNGQVKITLLVETAKGIVRLADLIAASTRIDSVILGSEDLCGSLGVKHSPDGTELLYALSKVVLHCKSDGLIPIGLLGSVANFQDLDEYERGAAAAMRLGCEGGFCIHPKQVPILNRLYCPARDEVDDARRVVECYEQAIKQGCGAVNFNGKMIDAPVYKRAQMVLQRHIRCMEDC